MIRLFNKDKKEKKKAKQQSLEKKSLDDVIRDKDAERKMLEEEEQEFQQKKREREKKIIHIEKEELGRREDEVRRKRSEYEEVKNNNEAVEDKLEGKIKELQMELEDKRLDHRSVEGSVEREINKRIKVIDDLRKSLSRRMDEYGGSETLPPSPTAPDLPCYGVPDSPTDKPLAEATTPYNPFESSQGENSKKMSLDLGNTFDASRGRAMENLKKSSNSLCKSLDNINKADIKEGKPSTRGRSVATAREQRYERTRSLHRVETEPVSLLYPTVPDLDPGEVYPSVPASDPGEEDDFFMTIKRSPKRSRAPKTPIDAVD